MAMPSRWVDRLVIAIARLAAAAFFRRIEVVGLPRLPRGRPLVLVGNHNNSLVDPLLFVAALPVMPRFLGKSTLWEKPLLRPILALAAVIPVYRRQDEGVDTSKNLETFGRCHELLAQGGSLGLFPEGISHNASRLAPIRTGAARIVLEAEERFPGLGVWVVPIGLIFDAKERFRSRVLVEVGEAIDPAPEIAAYTTDPQGAVRRLTARIEDGLEAVTLNYESWDEAALIGRAADLFERPGLSLPRDRSLAEDFSLHHQLIEGFAGLKARHPEHTSEVAARVASYERLLSAVGLADEQVASRYPVPSVLKFLLRSVPGLVASAPLAVVGMLLNWAPYRLAGAISRRVADEPDVASTYKLFPSLLLFPGFWLAEAILAWWLAGGWAALAASVAGPALGWLAVRFNDRRQSLVREARAYWLLATRQRLAEELRRRRRLAHVAVQSLVELAAAGASSQTVDDPSILS